MKRMEKAFMNIGLPNPRTEIVERYERRRRAAFQVFYRDLMNSWDDLDKQRDKELAALDK